MRRRLDTALLLLVAAFPLKSAIDLDTVLQVGAIPVVSLTKLAGVWFVGNLLLSFIIARRELRPDAMHAILIGLIVLAAASARQAADPSAALVSTCRYAFFIALCCAVAHLLIDDARLQTRVIWAWVTSSALAAGLALANFLPGRTLIAKTPYGDPNDVAFTLATALPLACWLLLRERRWRPLLALMVAAISASVVFSMSRGALVGIVAAVAWQLYTGPRRARAILALCVVPIVAVGALLWLNAAQVQLGVAAKQKVAWANVTNRLQAWGAATALAVQHPLLGVGPGNFQFHYAEYWQRPDTHHLRVVHNTYLEVAAELGIPAALLFGAFLILTFARLSAAAREGRDPPGLATAARASLIVAMCAGLFLSEQFFAPFWLLGALGSALWHSGVPSRTRRPRVIYVSSIETGGPLSHLLTLAPSMMRLGLDVRVVCASDDVAQAFRGVGCTAVAIPMRHKVDLTALARLGRLVRAGDIVHSQDRRAGLLARLVARARGAHAVHTLHGLPEEITARIGGQVMRSPHGVPWLRAAWHRHGYLRLEALLARLGTVVTPSHAMAGFLSQAGFPSHRLRVIPHSIDVRRSEPKPRGAVLVLGVVARLEPWKGIDVLLAACARVPQALRLEIFGDGSTRAQLEAQAAALRVPVRFHGHVRNVRAHLDHIDIFVLPSRAENLPMSILEAMANAVPVIATRVGGVAELVEDGRTGLLVAPDDVDALAGAIAALASRPELAANMGRSGARRARQHFDERTLAPLTARLYRERWDDAGDARARLARARDVPDAVRR